MIEKHPEKPPFESHRRYYLLLKIAILLVVLLLAVRYFAGDGVFL